MKNLVQKSLVLSLVLAAHGVHADPRIDLIRKGLGPMGAKSTIELAPATRSIFHQKLSQFLFFGEKNSAIEGSTAMLATPSLRSFARVSPKSGSDSAVELTRLHFKEDGSSTSIVAELPNVIDRPIKTEFTSTEFMSNGQVMGPIGVKRTFDLPSSHEKLHLEETILTKELSDGNYYTMVPEMVVTKGNQSARASMLSAGALESRKVSINLKTKADPNSTRNFFNYDVSGVFELPKEIPGRIITVNINLAGTRLTVKTDEGIEYGYAIEKNSTSRGDFDLSFRQIKLEKIAGGKKSLQADVKTTKGRDSKPVNGLDTEPIGSVGSAK